MCVCILTNVLVYLYILIQTLFIVCVGYDYNNEKLEGIEGHLFI